MDTNTNTNTKHVEAVVVGVVVREDWMQMRSFMKPLDHLIHVKAYFSTQAQAQTQAQAWAWAQRWNHGQGQGQDRK